jgi:hypothetical protein
MLIHTRRIEMFKSLCRGFINLIKNTMFQVAVQVLFALAVLI